MLDRQPIRQTHLFTTTTPPPSEKEGEEGEKLQLFSVDVHCHLACDRLTRVQMLLARKPSPHRSSTLPHVGVFFV